MNRQQWKERLPLIEAYVNGETIQVRVSEDDKWVDMVEPFLNADHLEYRIKPKPREWWGVCDRNGVLIQRGNERELSEKYLSEAKPASLPGFFAPYALVKITEVVE